MTLTPLPIGVTRAVVRLGSATVLDDVSVEVSEGAWVALIGPNGAGKTTLLRVIAGLCPVEAGQVVLNGRDVARMRARERARSLAYVAQDPVIPPGVSVADYVMLGRNPHIGFFSIERDQDRAVVASVFDRLELNAFATRLVETLSGGERQRVVLARALAQEPTVLLLDEPTAGLDLGHMQEVMGLVDELRVSHGLTVLSAIHDLTMAAQYAESLVLLEGGRVVATGTAPEVLTVERLSTHFRVNAEVILDSQGGLVVIPTRRGSGSPGC